MSRCRHPSPRKARCSCARMRSESACPMIRRGTYNWMPPLPGTPGTEMSSVVEKIGPGVKTLGPGQRVVVSARDRPHRGGCYAEYNVTPESSAYALPDGADMDQAAALANYQVAYHLLYD